MEKMLKVCQRKNMKLHPDKIQMGRRVEFGGVSVEASRARGDDQKRVYLSPSEQKLADFLDLKTPESKVEVQTLRRGDRTIVRPADDEVRQDGDILILYGPLEAVEASEEKLLGG